MVLSYFDMSQEILSVNANITEGSQIQKIFSSAYYIDIQIRNPGQTYHFYLGRGHGHEGVWLSDTSIRSEVRKKDRFLEYLRKHLAGQRIIRFEMDPDARGFSIVVSRWRKENFFYFAYIKRELYFQSALWNNDKERFEVFSSWSGQLGDIDFGFELFDQVGRKTVKDKTSSNSPISIQSLLKSEYKKAVSKGVGGKSLKFQKRKQKNIQNDLDRVLAYKELESQINKLDFEKLPKKSKILGIKFNFKTDKQFSRRDEVYKKIKKLKKAHEILSLRLKSTNDVLEKPQLDFKKTENKLAVVQPIWKHAKEVAKILVIDEYRVKEIQGYKVGIGSSAKGNEQLRSRFASKDDWWFHLDKEASAHIIVKNCNAIDESIIKLVGEEYCKMEKTVEVDMVYTQVKNVRSLKGKAGLVKFNKEKRRRYRSDNV